VRAVRIAILPAGVALGLYAEWAALQRGPLEQAATSGDVHLAAADFLVGVVFLACGLVAWTRRPESRTGLLLIVTGITWFLGTFAASGRSFYAALGAVFLTLHRGPIVHVLLSYPSGRVNRRTERAALGVAYALAAIAVVSTTAEGGVVLAVIVLAVAAQRFLAAAGPQRRARLPAAAASAAFAAALFVSAITRLAGSAASVDRGVLWAYQIVLVAIAIGLTLDLLLHRWETATVTGLIVDLGEGAEAGTLRDRLAQALGDSSLVLGYRLADRGIYVDDRGREIAVPEDGGDRGVTIVRQDGEPVAVLVHAAGVLATSDLVRSVAAAARIAVANARLQAEVRRQVEELEASRRRLVEAGDAERRRLERELRAGAERRLAEVETLLEVVGRGAKGGFAEALAETKTRLELTRAELQEFARGIHPRVLSDQGLAAALRDLAGRSTVPVDLVVPETRFSPPIEVAAYFVCSEALANVGKYAAASRAGIEISSIDGTLVVSVTDDGRGGAALDAGSGLRGLSDRVDALGGRLTVTSPPRKGTRLVALLPLT